VNRIALRLAQKGMKIKAWNAHILRPGGNIQRIKPAQGALHEIRFDLCRFTGAEKSLKLLMPPRFDHV
jgi:hypothetical protein